MNAALGVANTISSILQQFVQTITQPMAPQIIKSFASGDNNRCTSLLISSSKFSFLFMLVITAPFLSQPKYLLDLWLGDSPEYSEIFLVLLIINAIISTLKGELTSYVFATGNIKIYQIIESLILLTGVVTAYFVIKGGAPAYAFHITILCFTIIMQIFRLGLLKFLYDFKLKNYLIKAYLPCLFVALLYSIFFIFPMHLHPILIMAISVIYIIGLGYMIGLSKGERLIVTNSLKVVLNKLRNR